MIPSRKYVNERAIEKTKLFLTTKDFGSLKARVSGDIFVFVVGTIDGFNLHFRKTQSSRSDYLAITTIDKKSGFIYRFNFFFREKYYRKSNENYVFH